MKKVFSIIIIFLSGVFFAGCSLKETPIGLLSPSTFYKTQADFDAGMNGALFAIFGGWQFYNAGGAINVFSGAEDCKGPESWCYYMNFVENSQDGTLNSYWSSFYSCINNCNLLVANVTNANMSQTLKDSYEGEARFLRAWCYYFLTRSFGEIQIITADNTTNSANVAQSKVPDIFAYIVADLQKAETLLQDNPTNKLLPSKGAAELLLADVYLTMAGSPINDATNYAKAEVEAQKVITSGSYSLEPKFANLWKVSNSTTSPEIIFEFHGCSGSDWRYGSNLHIGTRPQEEGGWTAQYSDSLYYKAFPAGPRKDATFHSWFIFFNNGVADSIYWKNSLVSHQQPYTAKFRDAGPGATYPDYNPGGQVGSAQGGGFFTVQRFAEAYLIYAEAANQAEGSPSATALEYLNKIRRRAVGLNPDTPSPSVDLTGLSKQEFDDAVLSERMWEFAFESRRWFDVVRKNILMTAPIIQAEHGPGSPHPAHAYNVLFPKPASQLLLSKGLTQNPGY